MTGILPPTARHLLLALALLLTAALAHPRDRDVPESLVAHLASIDVLEGEFEQVRHIAVLAIPLQSSGTFRYHREQGIVWRTEHPVTSEIQITANQGIVAVDEHGDARTLPASEVVANIFLSLFSGELERLASYFTVDSIADNANTASTTQNWALHLTPRRPAIAGQIEHIRIAGSDYVETVVIQEANGDRSELTLNTASHREGRRE